MVPRLRWRLLAEVIFLLRLAFHDGLALSQGDDSLKKKAIWRSPSQVPDDVDVSECILLFAAFCNGNMGDVIQAASMRHLVDRLTARERCIWYAHPAKEDPANGFRQGEFFGDDFSRVLSLGCDSDSGRQVSRFKGLIVGGGGLLEARHEPLDCPDFVEGLGTHVPVAIFGVGASTEACYSAPLIQRAGYVSGRDEKSVAALAAVLETMDHARVQPDEVRTVRDPVLSDNYYTDVDRSCWREDAVFARKQPLCFVLPSALKNDLQELHQIFSSEIVRTGDVLMNVFPKHQAEIEAYNYSAPVEKILDPPTFLRRLCGCRAVVSSRLHGVILALHAGVPTIAAWPAAEGNKVPGLMNDVLRFPDQFLLVDKSLTRKVLDLRVAQVRIAYGRFGTQRLNEVFGRLDDIYRDTHEEGRRMLDGLLGLGLPDVVETVDDSIAGAFWREELSEQDGEANMIAGIDASSASADKVSDAGQVSRGAGLQVKNTVVLAYKGEIVEVKRDGSRENVPTGEGGKELAWTGAEVEPNMIEERPREEEAASEVAEGAAEDEKEKQTLAETPRSKGAPPEARSKEELPEATGEDRWEGAGSGTRIVKSADGSTAQEQKYSQEANVAAENPDAFFRNGLWKSWQGKEAMGQTPFPTVGHEDAFGGSWVYTLGALVLTALLGLPALSSLRKTEPHCNPVDRVPLVVEDGRVSTGASVTAVLKISTPLRFRVPRLSELVFFGVNYAIWVVLAVGFNVCSKRYLHVTRNPVALLAIQGWVGIAVLYASNSLARCRRSSSPFASVSSTPSWARRCGMRQGKGTESKVWRAGLLHCCNAVLTSWSVLLGGIAVTHALKALEPVAAAAFSRWLLGSALPPRRAAAVGVIVVGLGILTLPAHRPAWAGGTQPPDLKEAAASVGDANIELAIPALITACACCAVALRNVLLKGVNPPPPPPLSLLACSVVAAGVGSALLLLPWMPSSWESAGQPLLLASGVNASLCFVGYNLASLNLLSELSPVGHAVGNSSKRVCLFAAGLLLGEDRSITTRQLAGASVAFIGLTSYNMAGVASSSPRRG